jgi:Mg2+ and Co2+ transporter CorA
LQDVIITVHAQPIAGLELVMRRIGHEKNETLLCPPSRSMTIARNSDANDGSFFGHIYRSNAVKYEVENVDQCSVSLPAGADWILYAILDALCDRYIPNIDIVMKQVENLDSSIMSCHGFNQRENLLVRLGFVKKTVIALGRMLKQKQRIGLELISRQIRVITPNTQISLHDVVDRLTLARDRLEEAAVNLDYIHKNFLIKLQVRRMHSIAYKREMMKIVTMISAFTIPADTMLQYVSLSINTPGNDSTSLLGFFISCIIIFSISFVLVLWILHKFNIIVPKKQKKK